MLTPCWYPMDFVWLACDKIWIVINHFLQINWVDLTYIWLDQSSNSILCFDRFVPYHLEWNSNSHSYEIYTCLQWFRNVLQFEWLLEWDILFKGTPQYTDEWDTIFYWTRSDNEKTHLWLGCLPVMMSCPHIHTSCTSLSLCCSHRTLEWISALTKNRPLLPTTTQIIATYSASLVHQWYLQIKFWELTLALQLHMVTFHMIVYERELMNLVCIVFIMGSDLLNYNL